MLSSFQLLHQEAQDYLDSKQVDKAALTLLQFQSTQIRHQAVNQYNRRLRVALATRLPIAVVANDPPG